MSYHKGGSHRFLFSFLLLWVCILAIRFWSLALSSNPTRVSPAEYCSKWPIFCGQYTSWRTTVWLRLYRDPGRPILRLEAEIQSKRPTGGDQSGHQNKWKFLGRLWQKSHIVYVLYTEYK